MSAVLGAPAPAWRLSAPHAWTQQTAWAALLSLLGLAALAWMRPLMLPDEGRYVGVAWEMLRSGDWLTPTLNGLPYFHKPPLFYWITAGSMAVFGPGEWAARAAPLLGAWLAVVSSFLLVQRSWGGRSAWQLLALLLSMPLFYLGGQFANLDMLVAGCITACIAALAQACLALQAGRPQRRWLLLAAAMGALGVLAKGLIGAVLPLLVIGAWLLSSGWRPALAALRHLLWPPAITLFLLIALPWFVAMQLRFAGFAEYFFWVHHLRRFAAGGFNNVQPFWFFPAVLLLLSLPWLPWLRLPLRRALWADPTRGPLRRLALCWLLVVVGFFSLPQSKLLGYVLPALPALALLLVDGLGRSRLPAWAWTAACGLGVVLSLGALLVLSQMPRNSTREIGLLLRQQAAPGEPVLVLQGYRFDLPFYARLQQPVRVLEDWSPAQVAQRDNWRKELAEAAQFAPAAAAERLLDLKDVCAALAVHPHAWLVADAGAAQRLPLRAGQTPLLQADGMALWRIQRDALDPSCAETPNAGSPHR